MELLEERIKKDAQVLPGDILKVDNFLNHQIDVPFLSKVCEEFYRLYKDEGVNKILTIEASGIGIACLTAAYFNCPVVFAKKSKSSNIGDDFYSSEIYSYTHGNTNKVIVSKKYIGSADRILIIDDFLAKGNALVGLSDIVKQSGAVLVGAGIAVEKEYQGGGNMLRAAGMRIESLAKIKSMTDDGKLEFTK